MDVTKDYVDTQLRAQGRCPRFAEVLHGLGRIRDQIAAQNAISTERFTHLSSEVTYARSAAERAATAAVNTKWKILAAAIGVVAIILTGWALWSQSIVPSHGYSEHVRCNEQALHQSGVCLGVVADAA